MTVSTFKGVWAMCLIGKNGKLRATHYGSCMVAGRSPLWVLFTVKGNYVRHYGSKDAMMNDHPTHIWRRRMMRWNLADNRDMSDVKKRIASLENELPHDKDNIIPGGDEETPKSNHSRNQGVYP